MKIFLTGSTGFIGKNLIDYFKNKYQFTHLDRNKKSIVIEEDVVIHLAGKAHDLSTTQNPKEYYEINTELTKKVFDAFINSNAQTFIFLSSIKAVSDSPNEILTENSIPKPKTHYGKSKYLAENYILSHKLKGDKRAIILRPCMVHGIGNKGNLNLLYTFVTKGIPWILGSFENHRSYCSIDNLLFCIDEIITNQNFSSGIYNVADDVPLTTNKIIELISESKGTKPIIWQIPRKLIYIIFKVGDKLRLPINSVTLKKLTETYLVDNSKLKFNLGKNLPLSSIEGMRKTLKSFSNQ